MDRATSFSPSGGLSCWFYPFLRLLPKNLLSLIFGAAARLKLPKSMLVPILKIYARFFRVDISSSKRSLDQFSSLADFFVRELRPGLRPIGIPPVSPVDGVLRSAGSFSGGTLVQVKGINFNVTDLLDGGPYGHRFNEGIFFNFYLAPGDYHHVHSPVSGELRARTHVPGALWPVNDWSLRSIPCLFVRNERVITYLDTKFGLIAVIMVGAANVGRISVVYEDLVTQTLKCLNPLNRRTTHRTFTGKTVIESGQRIGTFNMGSTVLLLFEADSELAARIEELQFPRKVRYGEALYSGSQK